MRQARLTRGGAIAASARAAALAALAVMSEGLGVGCGDDAGLVCAPVAAGASRMLVDHDRWQLAPPEDDPWVEFRPADITCPDRARQPEDFLGTYAFGVLTADCPYTTVEQPAVADACKGETFYVWIWNYELTGPVGATAHLAVEVGGEVLWQADKPIPGPSGLVTERIVLDRDVPKGTPIRYHVRNHGSNSYELLELSIVNPDPSAPPSP